MSAPDQQPTPSGSKTARVGCVLAIGLLLLMALGLFFFLRSRIDSEAITQAVLSQLESSTGMQLEIDGFDRAGLFGATLRQPRVRSLLPAGCFSAEARALDIQWRLRPLLNRRVVIDALELVSPEVRLDADGQGPEEDGCYGLASGAASDSGGLAETVDSAAADADAGDSEAANFEAGNFEAGNFESGSAFAPAAIEVRKLLLSNGTIQVIDSSLALPEAEAAASTVDPQVVLALQELEIAITDIELATAAASMWQGARGEITASAMNSGGILANGVEGELQIDSGVLNVDPFAFNVPQGRIGTTLALELDRDPLAYTVSVGADVAVDKVIRGEDSEKTSMGTGRLDLKGGAIGTDPNDLKATGSLVLPPGSLDGHPIATALALVLGDPALVDLAYRTETAHFDIEDGRLVLSQPLLLLSDTSVAGQTVELEIGGSAGIDATTEPTLDLRVAARIPRSRLAIKELPEEVFDALENDEGLVELPLAIGGSLEEPKVLLDREAILRLAGNSLKREAGRRILRGLSRLIDG